MAHSEIQIYFSEYNLVMEKVYFFNQNHFILFINIFINTITITFELLTLYYKLTFHELSHLIINNVLKAFQYHYFHYQNLIELFYISFSSVAFDW
jgi:hypothetical protein